MIRSDEFYMHRAMDQAHLAFTNGEVPVGAVVVDTQGRLLVLATMHRWQAATPAATPRCVRYARRGSGWATTV